MQYTYRPSGVCSQLMEICVEGGILQHFQVMGGCDGNLKGIGRLVEGMSVDEVISRLEGIRCGSRNTSCPDQLAQALKQMKAELASSSEG
ncbi:MAG: TIGR03905 family TSCPD domain-containing protein [Oscillospiraceae bacterium]|nr:TIGR03905 family TSCPD domain-containing protein [Oscillospiraceae bacterium]